MSTQHISTTVSSGALRSPDDPNDYIYEKIAQSAEGYYIAPLPEVYDLRKNAMPSRDQGPRGTCAAFTAAAIKEIQESIDCKFDEWMSPEFIYFHRDTKPREGMYGRNVFQILQSIGSVPESAFPYSDTEPDKVPSDKLYKIAAEYRIASFARVTTVDGLKRAILEMGPCYLQLPLYTTRPEFWRASTPDEKAAGGHAVTVVGYTTEGFILKNSWGPEWNGDGCVVFPYEDWAIHWECWVSVDEKTMPPEYDKNPKSIVHRMGKKKSKDNPRCIIC